MNRKKIAALLTGLILTSNVFIGCGSSNNQTKAPDNNSKFAQEEPFLKRATERIITEFNEARDEVEAEKKQNFNNNPNLDVARANDNNIDQSGADTHNDSNMLPKVENFEDSTNGSIKNEMTQIPEIVDDYQMTPSVDSIPNNDVYNFENGNLSDGVNGFSNVIDEDLNQNNSFDDKNQTNSPKVKRDGDKLRQREVNREGKSQEIAEGNSKINTPRASVTDEQKSGQISVVKVKGSSEITSNKPQGIAEVSFKLSGDILGSDNLSTLLQEAYNETITDANASFSGTPTTTKREALQAALEKIFAPSDTEVKMIFQSNDGAVKIIPFKAAEMFPAKAKSQNYVRHIIDLEATSGQTRSTRNIDSSNIVMKMVVRVESVDGTELKTNTEYKFVGTEGDKNLKTTKITGTEKEQLVGLSMSNFKTGKVPSIVKATEGTTSVIYEGSGTDTEEGTQKADGLYLDQFTDKTYISMKKILDAANQIETTGTTIKFKSIILNDADKTITKIEIEDEKGKKYPVSLVAMDSNKPELGSYLEVRGLNRDSSYVFTKINLGYKIGTSNENKTLIFKNFDASKLEINKLPISTTAFATPQLKLGSTHDQQTILPNGLKVDTVKNDSTALRYVLKVDNPEGFVGDVKVNGLKAGEESKIEKLVDDKARVNYYIVTLSKLTPNTDYSFVILETDYKDPDGNSLIGRQALSEINKDAAVGTTDNKTEINALTGTQSFNVVIKETVTSKKSRNAEVPIFIDDMQDRFIRIDFKAPTNNPDAQIVYEDNKLKFSNLKPETSSVFTVNTIYKNDDGGESTIAKYIKVSTPKVSDFDIKGETITIMGTDAEIKFELYSEEKSQVKSVVVKDAQEKEIKTSWNKETKTLKLEGLKEKTEYSGLKATFTLENGKTVEYDLGSFTTGEQEVKPTGQVADFVARVYKIALGREPEVEGWKFWIGKLESKEISATTLIAENLMTQPEFVDRELSKKNFVTTMYSLIVNREPDSDGQSYWERKYDEYRQMTSSIEDLRIKIAREMMDQPEFKELVSNLGLKY